MSWARFVFHVARLEFSSWEDRDGQKRSKLRVVAATVQYLGGRAEDGGRDSRQAPSREAPPPAQQAPGAVRDSGPREDDYNLDDSDEQTALNGDALPVTTF